MKCTTENVNMIADMVIEMHLDSKTSYSIPEFDDKSDLLKAFEIVIGRVEAEEDYHYNGITFKDGRKRKW